MMIDIFVHTELRDQIIEVKLLHSFGVIFMNIIYKALKAFHKTKYDKITILVSEECNPYLVVSRHFDVFLFKT